MTVLSRKDAPRPSVPQETVPMPSLNGELVVQGLMFSDQVELAVLESTMNGHRHKSICETLERAVVDAEGQSFYTAQEWEIHGIRHREEVLKLFSVAKRLSAMDDDEKKDEAPSSSVLVPLPENSGAP